MKYVTFIICLLILFSCCKPSTISPESGNNLPDYFPLQVGNEWAYQKAIKDTNLYYVKIVDKVIINKREYYKVIDTNNLFVFEQGPFFARYADGKIYFYSTIYEKEDLLFDFTGTDTAYKRWHIVSFNQEDSIPIGKFHNCLVISPNYKEGIIGGMTYTFAPNIGTIRIYPDNADLILKHAKINGKQLF